MWLLNTENEIRFFPGEDKSRGAESGWSNIEIEGVIFRPSVNSNVLGPLPVRQKLEAI